jgi:hypothetical protein
LCAGCGLFVARVPGGWVGRSAAVADAARDGCACAQAYLDDHGLGTRPEGVVEALRSLPALTGIVALGGCALDCLLDRAVLSWA